MKFWWYMVYLSLSKKLGIAETLKSAAKKWGILFMSQVYSVCTKLDRGLFCLCLEDCSHMWGFSSIFLLEKFSVKNYLLISSLWITCHLEPLFLYTDIHFCYCSQTFADCMPPSVARVCSVLQTTLSHNIVWALAS